MSVYGCFQKNFIFFAALRVALFALGNMVHYFLLILVSGRHSLCLGVACGVQSFGFVVRVLPRRLMGKFLTFPHAAVDSDPDVSWSRCCL